jgi:hypothetical protein
MTQQPESNDKQSELAISSLSGEEIHELIARRAYELYQQRGAEAGDELSDWLRAEAEVLASIPTPARKQAIGAAAGVST